MLLPILLLSHLPLHAQLDSLDSCQAMAAVSDSLYVYNDSSRLHKHPWLAAAEATGINVAVNLADRLLNKSFSKVNLHTIHKYARKGFVWDEDEFPTNLLYHPYHGGLYFNAARTLGMNFWESTPYVIGESLLWEYFGEVEPPAINDFLSTSFGGIVFGETTFRLGNMLLDDSSRGWPRFFREFGAFLLNPVGGFNRVVSGDAWRYRSAYYKYHDSNRFPVRFQLSMGSRHIAVDSRFGRGKWDAYVTLGIDYGDAFSIQENRPYDYFCTSFTLGLGSGQPFVNDVHVVGRLWGFPVSEGRQWQVLGGLYQHYNYYNTRKITGQPLDNPLLISETASLGAGLHALYTSPTGSVALDQRLYLNGVILGGITSDYDEVLSRNYNMGSGFALKYHVALSLGRIASVGFHADYLRLFSWKGYEDRDYSHTEPLCRDAQGETSNAEVLILNPSLRVHAYKSLYLHATSTFFVRKSRYSYYDDVHRNIVELQIGLSCLF